jgi:hypothetical protein
MTAPTAKTAMPPTSTASVWPFIDATTKASHT